MTGPTGVGKSTTMAAMVRHLNENRECNVICIEDPIEYVHPNVKSIIAQGSWEMIRAPSAQP